MSFRIVFLYVVLLVSCKNEARYTPTLVIDSTLFSEDAVKQYDSLFYLREQRASDSLNMNGLADALKDSVNRDYFTLISFYRDTIPQQVFKLTRITELNIKHTYINRLPENLCELKKLEDLDLSGNRLNDIDNLVCLENLVRLDLLGNKLSTLPADFSKLKKLKYLTLSNNNFLNGIDALPPNLEEIAIAYSNLKDFPIAILKLESITMINLANNPQIQTLPEGIEKLNNLEVLILSNTKIRRIEIDMLQKLMPSCRIVYSYAKE